MISWVLVNYLLLLLFFAVLGRRSLDYYRYNLEVGYSYRDVFLAGDPTLAMQIVANIAAFVPVGGMTCLLAKRFPFLKGLLCGAVMSLCIELLQLVLRCGYFEFDDLISNSLGTLIGCLLAALCKRILHRTSASSSV